MTPIKPFNLMIKPVCSTCNLDCVYCYYKLKSRELYQNDKAPKMSDDLLENITAQYLRAMPVRCVFNWQGGEPLLAGLDFFRKAVSLQKERALPGQQIENNIQTNGTLLTDEWCLFLRDNKFLVGISIDGPEQLHDAFRRDAAGKGTFKDAWKGLELLANHGVEYNVLVTLNSANASKGKEIYRFLVNRGVKYIQFIPILERNPDGTAPAFSCPPDEFGSFMVDVFSCWKERDIGKVSVRFIDDAVFYLVTGRYASCYNCRKCAHAFVVEWNADLFACDHFVFREWRIGNIKDEPLESLLKSPLLERFSRLKTDLPRNCRECEYLQFCNGGCPKHHVPAVLVPDRVNYFCGAYKAFYAAALNMLKHLAETVKAQNTANKLFSRNGRLPAPGKKTGRNAPCLCGSGRKFKLCCGR